jgi:hypothetical protein
MLGHVKTSNTKTAFGSLMPQRLQSASIYRFGWNNGSEKDDEITGNIGTHYIAEYWEYDSRLGRRWNTDPLPVEWESPYATMQRTRANYNFLVRIFEIGTKSTHFSHRLCHINECASPKHLKFPCKKN